MISQDEDISLNRSVYHNDKSSSQKLKRDIRISYIQVYFKIFARKCIWIRMIQVWPWDMNRSVNKENILLLAGILDIRKESKKKKKTIKKRIKTIIK